MSDQASEPVITPSGPSPAVSAEAARMAAVRRYDILDTPPDGAYDRVAALAARLFDMPVATVTIVDEDRIWFKAAHGLDGVTQIGRDPGLCGSAVLRDDTTVIPDTLADPVARSNPLVAGPMGVRFYAAAPIITADGHRLGTVNVLDTRPRELDEADADTLADLAAMVRDQLELRLSALNAVRAEQERRQVEAEARRRAERDKAAITEFASTLQRTLVPPALPAVPGLELACHYKTASPQEVGGDFYDVFPVGGGRWAFFLGDVCGKGAEAASITSLTRYTLRAAALVDADPTAALQALNTALLLDAAVGTRFCTAVIGMIEPSADGSFTVKVATGGHPPAYHLSPIEGAGVRVEEVRAKGGMLVGAFAEATFASRTLHLEPGQGLLLYTDGLTEARTAAGEMLTEDGLAAFLAKRPRPISAVALIEDTVALLDTLPDTERDDVAVLALSVPTADAAPMGITATAHSAAAPAGNFVGQENRRS
ncbi:PP2C family protein-serine/threonine phosphatase [Streptomyces sp. B1I3]|uniref:PP2C family protein-serine/threonine phosphatase n=1 Tax=Streptomyces sp. B1I3 TaxID=3042264 RepID=UPI0027851F3A|nr:GAF domain-containing SpoIIE family protein phosphatase [Streptomyces sp. B1I3]MDQ0798142.1 sigma-B regulation protein RsbU (phosphoserine phosphatase) [Streptomyces sp. B1I3]